MIEQLVLATHNAKKLAELRRIMADSGLEVQVLGLDDLPAYPEPAETEFTFEGNALLKAREAAARTGFPSLADDSGIAMDVLNGMPGVRSARWAGPDSSDQQNLDLLLRQVADVDDPHRTGKFVCAMALVQPYVGEHVIVREMPGRLGREARGTNGFGYDPAFIAAGHDVTNGELSPGEKDAISHRGQAVRAMVAYIHQLNAGDDQ
jgi:XTP/dITP diphosphohydrolase